MKSICGIIFAAELLFVPVAYSTIKNFTTFEDSTLQYLNPVGNVTLVYDSPYQPGYIPSFRRQNHGIVSLLIQSSGTATGIKIPTFLEDTVSSYLVDFYVNIPSQTGSITNFVIYNGTHQGTLTDVKISLLNNGQGYGVQVQHAGGTSYFLGDSFKLYPDTVIHPQNWYRFQIYRRADSVYVFLNGAQMGQGLLSIGTDIPDSFFIGFEDTGNGSVLIDDIIVRTPDYSVHPRLFFTPSDIPMLIAKSSDYNPGTSGIPPGVLWDTMYTRAERLVSTDTVTFEIHGVPYTYVYPFEFPPPAWTAILYQAYIPQYVQLEGFVYALTNDSTFANRVRNILLTLANWTQWEWPYYYQNPVLLYIETQGFHYMLTEVIGYDLIYDKLTDFERMSIENSILVKGLEQVYLALTVGELGNRPIRHNKQLVGAATSILGSLVLSDTSITSKYLNVALQLIQDYFSDPYESYDLTTGAAREPIFYAQYAFTHLGMAGWALYKNGYPNFLPQLKPFVYYMSQCQIPGGHKYVPFGDAPKVIDGYMEQFPEFYALIASSQMMPLSQWFLMKNNTYWGFFGQGLVGSYLFFGTFLWLDNTVSLRDPESLNLPFAQGFSTSGISILRNGWDSPINLFYSIKSRDNNKIHNHFDNNSISIAYNGKWLIGEHPDPYGRPSTELHNTMVIFNGVDTIRQISGYDRGQITVSYEDSVLLYTEAQARLSYRLNQGSPAVFLNNFSRSAILFLKDTLLLLMDVIKLPNDYKSRLQFKFHSQGELTVFSDAFIIDYPDTASLYSKLWTSSPVTLSSYQFDPEMVGITVTTDTSVTEFNALYLMKPGIYPTPVDFQVINRDSVIELIIDNDTYVFIFDNLNSYSYRFLSTNPSQHIWTGLIPGTRYWFRVLTPDTFFFDSLLSDQSSIGTMNLPGLDDSAEIYVYSVQSGTPYPLTFPNTQKKILRSKHLNAVVYDEGGMVFYAQKNPTTWDTPVLVDIGEHITGTFLPGTDIPAVVYIGKRLNSHILILKWGENLENAQVLDTIYNGADVKFGYPGIYALSEDTIVVAYPKVEDDDEWYLLIQIISLTHGVLDVDTLNHGAMNGFTLVQLGAPVMLYENQRLIVTWIKPRNSGTSVYFTYKDTVWHEPVNISRSNHGLSMAPQISSSGSILYITWENDGDIYFSTYDFEEGLLSSIIAVEDGADTLSAPIFLTTQDIICTKWEERSSIVRYRFTGVGWEFFEEFVSSGNYPQYPQASKGTNNDHWIVWTELNSNGYSLVDTLIHVRERTYLHGTIIQDTTWSDSVFVNGDITVAPQVTLRLMPGTVVVIVSNYDFRETGLDPQRTELRVKGNLIAKGTWRSPIVIKTPQPLGTWTGIVIDSGAVDTLINTYIEGGDVGIWCEENSSSFLDSTTIANINEWAVYSHKGFLEIYRSSLNTTSGGGIVLDSSWAVIKGNLIRSSNVGIRLTTPAGYIVIDSNEITGGGRGVGIDAIKTHSSFRLRYNTVGGYDVAIQLTQASPEIIGNSLESNYVPILSGPYSSPIVLANELLTDFVGVYASHNSVPFMGDEGVGQPGFNSIRADRYAVVNASQSANPIMAEMNWWGTPSPSMSMFWGEVDYVPYLNSPPNQDYTTSEKGNFGFTNPSPPKLTIKQNIVKGVVKVVFENLPVNSKFYYKVYDILGREINRGMVGTKKSVGSIEIPLRTKTNNKLPSGIYFIRIGFNWKTERIWRILNL